MLRYARKNAPLHARLPARGFFRVHFTKFVIACSLISALNSNPMFSKPDTLSAPPSAKDGTELVPSFSPEEKPSSNRAAAYDKQYLETVFRVNYAKFKEKVSKVGDINLRRILLDRWDAIVEVVMGGEDIYATPGAKLPDGTHAFTFKNEETRDKVIEVFNSIFQRENPGDLQIRLVPLGWSEDQKGRDRCGYRLEGGTLQMPSENEVSKIPFQPIVLPPTDFTTNPKQIGPVGELNVKVDQAAPPTFDQLPSVNTYAHNNAAKVSTSSIFSSTFAQAVADIEGEGAAVGRLLSQNWANSRQSSDAAINYLYGTNYNAVNERFVYSTFVLSNQLLSKIQNVQQKEQMFSLELTGDFGYEGAHYVFGFDDEYDDFLGGSFRITAGVSNYQMPLKAGKLRAVFMPKFGWVAARAAYMRNMWKLKAGISLAGFAYPTDAVLIFPKGGNYNDPIVEMELPPSIKTKSIPTALMGRIPIEFHFGKNHLGIAPTFTTFMELKGGTTLTPTARMSLEPSMSFDFGWLRFGAQAHLTLYDPEIFRRFGWFAEVPLDRPFDNVILFVNNASDAANPDLTGTQFGAAVKSNHFQMKFYFTHGLEYVQNASPVSVFGAGNLMPAFSIALMY